MGTCMLTHTGSKACCEGILCLGVWSLTGSRTYTAQQSTCIACVPMPTRLAQCSGYTMHVVWDQNDRGVTCSLLCLAHTASVTSHQALQMSATLEFVHPTTQSPQELCCCLLDARFTCNSGRCSQTGAGCQACPTPCGAGRGGMPA